MRVFFLKVAIILRWMQRNGDCQTEPRLTEPYYEYINTIYSYTWNIYSMYISSVIAYHIYIPSNHPAVISHQHTILDPHGSCIPSDCPSTWWLQCAVVMERVFSSDNMQAGKPRIIWTKRLEPLGVLGAVQKGQLEYLETIWIWYNWTIYPTIGYNWFLWQQLLIECATKKKTTSISIQDADHNFSAKDDIVLVYGCSFDHLAMVKNWKIPCFLGHIVIANEFNISITATITRHFKRL